jgi:putative transcriptional regulator
MNEVDVREIRKALGLTQIEFSRRFKFPLGTLRHWEQGHRSPIGSSRVLLMLIARIPDIVQDALNSSRAA